MGPRAIRKERQFLEEAKREQKVDAQKMEQSQQQCCLEKKRSKNSMPVFENIDDNSDKFEEAITFWGQQRSNHTIPTFAKCSSFTNDIHDGRLSHR